MNKCMAVVALLGSAVAFAQTDNFPAKPLRLVAPFPPGGSVDLVGRLVGAKLGQILGQQVIIDNRSGASGIIGTEFVARAAPDGYTLLINTLPFVTNAFIISRVPYDVVNDFAPVSLLSSSASVLTVHPSVPAHSVKDLLQIAKSRPGTLNYGSAGIGTNPHIAGELFNLLGKVNIVAVQFKGGGPALVAVISGELSVTVTGISETMPFVEGKKLRALGVTSVKRSPALPDVPPIADTVPGYEFTTWQGILAPKAHAARHRRDAQRKNPAGDARSRFCRTVRAKGFRHHRQHARRVRSPLEEGAREMGQGHQGKRHARGLESPSHRRVNAVAADVSRGR